MLQNHYNNDLINLLSLAKDDKLLPNKPGVAAPGLYPTFPLCSFTKKSRQKIPNKYHPTGSN